MYSYAISFSDQEVTTQIWQEAMTHSEIHKIEYSAGGDDFDVFRRSVKALFSRQESWKWPAFISPSGHFLSGASLRPMKPPDVKG